MKSKVAIIILNWNGLKDTRNCLNSLLKEASRKKILVIDNGSNVNEAAILKKEFDVSISTYRSDKNLGFTGGANLGIKLLKQDDPLFYLFLNNDTEVDSDFLQYLLESADRYREVGILTPAIYDYTERNKPIWTGGEINWILGRPYNVVDLPDKPRFTKWITGCSMLVKKGTIKKIGGFDDKFFAYFEDFAFCQDAKKAGIKCLVIPKSKIYHKVSSSSKKSSLLYTYLFSRNRILFVNNYTNIFYKSYFHIFNLSKTLLTVIYFAVSNQQLRLLYFLKGYRDGILNIGGQPRI